MTTKITAAETAKKGRRPRRTLLRLLALLLAAALVLGAAVFLYDRYTKTHYKTTFYRESSEKVSDRIRVAVVSDIHVREYGPGNETLLSDLRSLEPDLILFPGDMIIRESDDYQPALDLVTASAGIAPCYGVLGNHESERIYYGGDKEIPKRFRDAGLKLLRNSKDEILIGEDRIQMIGIEGTTYGFDEYGKKFMDKAEIDPSAYCILMAHIPILFDPQLSGYGFDLGIAGHVHGGKVILPFLGGLYSYEEGFFPKYYAGRYVLEKGQILIISRGLGDSDDFPPRINNTPELVVIDIDPR